jgi:hypothetical protein
VYIFFSDPARAANRVQATNRPDTGSKTPLSTSGVRLISVMCGRRVKSGTNSNVFAEGGGATGPLLCTEVAAVVAIEGVIRDDMLGETDIVDFVVGVNLVTPGLAIPSLDEGLRIEAGLEVMDEVAFIDSMRCL